MNQLDNSMSHIQCTYIQFGAGWASKSDLCHPIHLSVVVPDDHGLDTRHASKGGEL
jgi:hypothetical protein